MVVDCNKIIGKGHLYRGALWNVLKIIRRCRSEDFSGELDQPHEPRVPEAEVNKRLSGHELNYTGIRDRIIFSANQVGVNRPVEDRWIAYQFGHSTQNTLYCSKLTCPSDSPEGTHYGGTAFTVVDGHGGHACAHAINLLHSDYLVASLLPPELGEQVLFDMRAIEGTHTPFSCELSETLWSRFEAIPTGESEYIGPPGSYTPTETNQSLIDPNRRWAPWGIWGPLAASVREVHISHLRKLIEESLSCSFEGSEAYFSDNDQGDVCDPEGFIVAPVRSIQEAVAAEMSNNSFARHPDPFQPLSINRLASHTTNTLSPFLVDVHHPDVLRLHDRVAGITRSIRNAMRRMDLDLSTAAQPSHRGPSLDKALLRIVFSGCVATSAYIPCNGKELFLTQVGDCGAVLGSFVPSPISSYLPDGDGDPVMPTEYSPLDWKAELLISPHNADNVADVQRLKSSHPVHESAFVIRDDRLLGELMPLRAFGDIRFKWPLDELKHVARLLDLPPNYPIMPSFYATPPYLCSTPQMFWKPLIKNRDHFLILATDGLWDMLTPKDAIHVVAQHWFDYNCDPSASGPGDTAATRLIRTALGGEHMDPLRISAHFSMPATVARYYRDDITVVVVYLPTAAFPDPGR